MKKKKGGAYKTCSTVPASVNSGLVVTVIHRPAGQAPAQRNCLTTFYGDFRISFLLHENSPMEIFILSVVL